MYTPTHYKVENFEQIKEVIADAPFATLLAAEGISHLPFILQEEKGHLTLLSHMARANSQKIKSGDSAQILFHGPHVYVSPAHYTPDHSNVPTWNYVAVHAKGTVEIITEHTQVEKAMKDLIEHFENRYETGWTYEARPEQTIMYDGITVFKVTNLTFEAKFKLSQNQSSVNRDAVAEDLPKLGKLQTYAHAISSWMKRT